MPWLWPRCRQATSAALTVVVLAAVAATPASAAGSGGPGLSVSGGATGSVVIAPGGLTTEVFTVTDNGRTNLAVSIAITGLSTNGTAPQFTGTPSAGLAVTVRPQTFTLTPQTGQSVIVTLAAAPHSPPGGLFAGLVFRGQAPASASQVRVIGEVGEPLFVRVPGALIDTGIVEGFTPAGSPSPQGSVSVVLRFHNTGTVEYPLTGSVTFRAATGAPVTVGLPRDVVLPTDHRSITVTWTGPAPPGPLRAVLMVRWGLTGEHVGTASTSVQVPATTNGTASSVQGAPGHSSRHTAVSWLVRTIAGALVGLLLLALLLLWLAARRRRPEDDPVPAEAKQTVAVP